MKIIRYPNSEEALTRIRKFSNQLKKMLYRWFVPHRVSGCTTSPTYYIHLVSMQDKDKIIRISNHVSKNPFYHSANVFNVIITEDVDNTWTQKRISEIQKWIKEGGENGESNTDK